MCSSLSRLKGQRAWGLLQKAERRRWMAMGWYEEKVSCCPYARHLPGPLSIRVLPLCRWTRSNRANHVLGTAGWNYCKPILPCVPAFLGSGEAFLLLRLWTMRKSPARSSTRTLLLSPILSSSRRSCRPHFYHPFSKAKDRSVCGRRSSTGARSATRRAAAGRAQLVRLELPLWKQRHPSHCCLSVAGNETGRMRW